MQIDNHIFYTDGIVKCPPHLVTLRDICYYKTLFININRKTFIEIETIVSTLLNKYTWVEQIFFDHVGDPVYNRELSAKLNTWIKSKGIRGILATSEWTKHTHSDLKEVFCINTLVSVKSYSAQELNLDSKKYRYSCLNRNPQWFRLLFYTMLKHNNKLNNNIYTFYNRDPYNDCKIDYRYYIHQIKLFENYYKQSMENIKDFPISWPNDIQGKNDHSIKHDAYLDAECNIVTESAVDVEFTSEKIWKPISSGQCFHIAGSAGTNRWLNSLGFETFDRYYDSTKNSIERLEQVVNQLDGNSMWTPENLDKISHNYHLFYSGEVEKAILDPLVAILDQ